MAASAALAASSALACTPLDAEDDTYDSLIQGIRGGAPSQEPPVPTQTEPADWSCLGAPTPAPPPNLPRTVRYTFPLVDWVAGNPMPGRKITVCNRVDPTCSSPVPATTEIDDSDPNVSVDVPTGLPIYLILEAPGGFLKTFLFVDGPLYSDQTGGRIQFLTQQIIVGLATEAQIAINPMLGVVAVRPHDCKGNIIEGALYSLSRPDASSIPYTFVNGLVRTTETPPVPRAATTIPNDYSPWAGFTNVPEGALTIIGKLEEDGREFGTADVRISGQAMNAIEIRAANRL